MYTILKGYIEGVSSNKYKDGITTYDVKCSTGRYDNPSKILVKNVKHGLQSDPDTEDKLYGKGTSVYLIGILEDSKLGPPTIGDPVIICAVGKEKSMFKKMASNVGDLSDLDEGYEENPITGIGDVVVKKGKGFFHHAYEHFWYLVIEPGLEILLNKVTHTIKMISRKFNFIFGNYGTLSIEDTNDSEAFLEFFLNDDTGGVDRTDASSVSVRIGKCYDEDSEKKIRIAVLDNQTRKVTTSFFIDRFGKVSLTASEVNLNVKDPLTGELKASLDIDTEGNAVMKTETLKLGKGETDQYFIRGKAMQENYDKLLEYVKNHQHFVASGRAIKSESLQTIKAELSLTEDVELSTTNKLD